jgi:hypothetical protein
MTHKNCSPGRSPIGLLLAVALVLAVPASAEWKEKVLYSFQGGTSDGSVPAGGVVFDSQGNLYGSTTDGGPASCKPIGRACGTVFQLSPPTLSGDPWTETLIYRFQGKGSNDGSVPSGGLIRDAAGNLYGVTAYGGTGDCVLLGVPAGCGTVYKLSPPRQKGGAWRETILYSFPAAQQGYLPNGDLVFDSAGNLYGATVFGGGKGTTCDKFYRYCGAVFEMSPPKTKGGKWMEKVLHAFAGGMDGANPNGGLVLDSKGNIYGTTPIGGYNCAHNSGLGCGTVFELKPPTVKGGPWTERQLHIFKDGNDGAQPTAGVILGTGGFIYGAAEGGSEGCGVVFRLAASSGGRWEETVLYSFGGNTYYYGPAVSHVDSSGRVYGTTHVGPGSLAGSVFRLKPPTRKGGAWTASVLYGFTGGSDGRFPSSTLIFDVAGNLYGATQEGGGGGTCQGYCGSVFEIEP